MTSVHLIITAAGLSRRHPDKLIYKIDGQPAIAKTVAAFIDTAVNITVVVGHHSAIITKVLHQFADRISIVDNRHYAQGLSTSLLAGIKSAGEIPDYWAFHNGDKPFIAKTTIESLLKELERCHPKILVPMMSDKNGHPCFLSGSLTADLLQLNGDQGARQLLRRFQQQVLTVPINDHGVILDMDEYLELTDKNTNGSFA